jgi:hypothetical protein
LGRVAVSRQPSGLGHRSADTYSAGDDLRPAVTAYFALEAIAFAIRSADPRRALDTAFNVIVNGASIVWSMPSSHSDRVVFPLFSAHRTLRIDHIE